MTPRITLICHGTTKALRAATFGGDDCLDQSGAAQARALAGLLGAVTRSWTSPAARARETAAALGLAPVVDERLRECDFGRWTGRKLSQVLLSEPRKLVRWMRDPASAPHGGESIPQVLTRVSAWLTEQEREPGHTVAVTHSSVIRAVLVHVLQAGLPAFWRIDLTPLSRTELRTNGRRWVLRSITAADSP